MKSSLAPLSSIEATIGGMNSFVKTICTEYPDLFDGKEVRLLNRREAVVLFETHRHLLLPNGSQFSSTPQTIRSLVHNIHFLKSRGVTPPPTPPSSPFSTPRDPKIPTSQNTAPSALSFPSSTSCCATADSPPTAMCSRDYSNPRSFWTSWADRWPHVIGSRHRVLPSSPQTVSSCPGDACEE